MASLKTDLRDGEDMDNAKVGQIAMAVLAIVILAAGMNSMEFGKVALIALTVGLLFFIWQLRNRNLAREANRVKIAGQDELAGGAKDPSAFDEPDDDALDQMQDLLEASAEAQGITYEE